jgi:ketosteroid isomerase-like protein
MRRSVLAFVFLLAGCAPGTTLLTEEDVASVRELGQSYARGFSTGDAATVAAVYADGAVEIPPNFPIRDGVAAIRSAYEAYFQAGAETVEFDMTAVEIDGYDGLAFDRGTWSWTGREGAGMDLVTQTGSYLSIARRRPDGTWRYSAMIWNSDTPLSP